MTLPTPRASLRLLLTVAVATGPVLGCNKPAPAAAAPAQRVASAPVQVKGTHVSLVPPEGFVEATRFTGFIHPELQAAIQLREYPLSSVMVIAGFKEDALEAQGGKVLSRENVLVSGMPGILVHMTETRPDGGSYRWWILAMGDSSGTLVVKANWREQDSAALSKPIETALRSLSWNRDAERPPGPQLFTLKALPGLKEAERTAVGATYTRDGKPPSDASPQPTLTISRFPRRKNMGQEMSAFARSELEGMSAIKDSLIESSAALTVEGLQGHEFVTREKTPAAGRNFTHYYALLMGEQHGFLFQGLVDEADRDAYVEHFKQAVRGFQPTTKD